MIRRWVRVQKDGHEASGKCRNVAMIEFNPGKQVHAKVMGTFFLLGLDSTSILANGHKRRFLGFFDDL